MYYSIYGILLREAMIVCVPKIESWTKKHWSFYLVTLSYTCSNIFGYLRCMISLKYLVLQCSYPGVLKFVCSCIPHPQAKWAPRKLWFMQSPGSQVRSCKVSRVWPHRPRSLSFLHHRRQLGWVVFRRDVSSDWERLSWLLAACVYFSTLLPLW